MILLKKEVNEILEANGLPELTVDNQNKVLCIVGRKCGQPMMVINGITPSSKMTAKERQIVLDDYLIPVITLHKKDFENVIKIKQAIKANEQATKLEVERLNTLDDLVVKVAATYSYSNKVRGLNIKAKITAKNDECLAIFSPSTIEIPTCKYPMFAKVYNKVLKYKPELSTLTKLVERTNALKNSAITAENNLIASCGW